MTVAVDRAAEVINEAWEMSSSLLPGGRGAQALADAGLLVTDEIQAVLDAADAWLGAGPISEWPLPQAIVAYRASRQS